MSKRWTELSNLPLSTRTRNVLISAGITTADAIPESREDLWQIPGLGGKGLEEIDSWRAGRENWKEFYSSIPLS
jgi:DNA-directed RNA polymerase alpha subunit